MSIKILLLPLLAGLIAQLVKFFIKSNNQSFNIKNLMAYSGMPSGHTAMIIALATIVGLEEGLYSPLFAVCTVLAIIIVRDALGIRRYLGQHGRTLNALVKDLKEDELLDANYPHLLERIGHTPPQVIAGALVGFLISIFGYYM
jgi:acid phosphatase family membrane protein YuiD